MGGVLIIVKLLVKPEGIWWNPKTYPSVPYLFNLLMDPMERMDQQSHEFGSAARRFFDAEEARRRARVA